MEDDELERYCEVCFCVPCDGVLEINCIPDDPEHDLYMCQSCSLSFYS